jgi:hypothetical protein
MTSGRRETIRSNPRKGQGMATTAETRARTTDWERYAPLAGFVAVACWVVGLALDSIVNKEDGARLLLAYKLHDNRIGGAGWLWLVGTAAFVWFLGSLRVRLLAAEGPAGRLTSIAFAGGVGAAVCIALLPGGDMAAAFSKKHIDASSAVALHNMGSAFFLGAEFLLPLLLIAGALVALRTRAVLPRWFAWLTVLVGIVLLIPPIGWLGVIFAFPVWVLIVTFLLIRPGPVSKTV